MRPLVGAQDVQPQLPRELLPTARGGGIEDSIEIFGSFQQDVPPTLVSKHLSPIAKSVFEDKSHKRYGVSNFSRELISGLLGRRLAVVRVILYATRIHSH